MSFFESTKDESASSAVEVGLEQSDMETSSSEDTMDVSAPKDYWFGRKYFECVLAQQILQGSRLHESVAQVDSQLEGAIHGFPYNQSLIELKSQGLEPLLPVADIDDPGAYRVMMFSIGAIIRNGDRMQKAALLRVLRRCYVKSDHFDSHWQSDGHSRESVNGKNDALKMEHLIDDESEISFDLGRYATALQCYGDKHGFVLTYSITEISSFPPRFRATIKVGGSTYVGIAKTKKQARHKAAQEVCFALGINV